MIKKSRWFSSILQSDYLKIKLCSKFSFLALAMVLSGCERVEYDHKNLGFSDKVEMEAAFAKGYHTKQKLMEMNPPSAVVTAGTAPAAAPQISESANPAASAPLTTAPDPVSAQAVEPALPAIPAPPTVTSLQVEPNTPVAENNPFSPSFDCKKASNGIERLICSDRELSKLDVDLGQLYLKSRNSSIDKDRLKSEQIAWIRTSRACSDKFCLKKSFEQRIAELSK